MAWRKFNPKRQRRRSARPPRGGIGGIAPDGQHAAPSFGTGNYRGALPQNNHGTPSRWVAGYCTPSCRGGGGVSAALPRGAGSIKDNQGLPLPDNQNNAPAWGGWGLCGQVNNCYYSPDIRKSFRGIIFNGECTSYKVKKGKELPAHVLEHRRNQGLAFKGLYRCHGWTRAQTAKFLHVTERTLHNWENGSVALPPMALKLLRVTFRYELPSPAWVITLFG